MPDWREEEKDLDRRFNFYLVSRITVIPTEVQTLQLPNGFLGRGVDRHAHIIIYSVAVDASTVSSCTRRFNADGNAAL
jgi:hypothetical protein